MIHRKWIGILLPAGLGLAGLALLLRVSVLDSAIDFPGDLDLLIFLLGLSLAIFASANLVVREVLERLRQQSVEMARQQALAEHRRFLNRLDHELKNPLTALRAGLGSLAITLVDTPQRALVETLEAETQRLSRLVNNLRKLTELETLPLEVRLIDSRQFIDEVLQLEADPIISSGRKLEVELPERWPLIIGDPDLLLLMLHNLLDNARKYTHPGDTITLQVRVDDGDLLIVVMDTGIGIPSGEIPLVWEDLYRGQQVREIPGSGIGLTLVKTIIERHYGQVRLESAPGAGTSVYVRLPVA